jgi:hypothetical protein
MAAVGELVRSTSGAWITRPPGDKREVLRLNAGERCYSESIHTTRLPKSNKHFALLRSTSVSRLTCAEYHHRTEARVQKFSQ